MRAKGTHCKGKDLAPAGKSKEQVASLQTLEIALYNRLGDLPELKSTHRFF